MGTKLKRIFEMQIYFFRLRKWRRFFFCVIRKNLRRLRAVQK